jgi:acyl-ACP thioesterase
VARWLQDVAGDDVRDAGLAGLTGWVVRRTSVWAFARPRYEETVELETWCAGMALAWTERRTTVRQGPQVLYEAASLWVAVEPPSLRPCRIPDAVVAAHAVPPGTKRPDARLVHPAPPAGVQGRPWSLRRTDFDVYAHLNNAASWSAVSDALTAEQEDRVSWAEVEYRASVEPGAQLRVLHAAQPEGLGLWLHDGTQVVVSAQLRFA